MIWQLRGFRNRMIKKAFGCSTHYFRELNASQWYSKEQLQQLQDQRLRQVICAAYENVPYYQALFKKLKLRPEAIQTCADLAQLPVLEKETIRENPEAFVDRSQQRWLLYRCHTSGTTGKPLTIYRDIENVWYEHAVLRRQWHWGGMTRADRYATLKGEMLVPKNQERAPFWRENRAERKLMLSIFHLSAANSRHYLRALECYQPAALEGYPSTVHVLAQLLMNEPVHLRLKAIFTSSETLLEHQRDMIQQVFKAPIFDFYGSVERVVAIHTCEHGRYHLLPEYSVVELLPEGDLRKNGLCQLVGTSLHNAAMPLIRYRIGDLVEPDAENCPCGRQYPVIGRIAGRDDDYIQTPAGRWITRLDFIFKGVAGICEAQIVQTRLDEIVIKIVPASDYRPESGEIIRAKLADRLRDRVNIKVELVPVIPRTERGKFRAILSKVTGIDASSELTPTLPLWQERGTR